MFHLCLGIMSVFNVIYYYFTYIDLLLRGRVKTKTLETHATPATLHHYSEISSHLIPLYVDQRLRVATEVAGAVCVLQNNTITQRSSTFDFQGTIVKISLLDI